MNKTYAISYNSNFKRKLIRVRKGFSTMFSTNIAENLVELLSLDRLVTVK
jgi:hypothetical protein